MLRVVRLRRLSPTNVIVILLVFMPQFKLWNDNNRIWCDFGTGVKRKTISINSIYERLEEAMYLLPTLPFPFFTRSVDVTVLHTSSTTQRTSCMIFGLFSDTRGS